MADNTWTGLNQGVAFAVNKVMAGVLNGGARVLRVARCGVLNNQTAAVTGVVCMFSVRKYTAGAGWTTPTSVSPVAHDSTNSALSSVTHGNSGTPTGTMAELRRILWSSDEPSASTGTNDEFECIVPFNIIWDCGYGDTDTQKLTLRGSESFMIYNTVGAAGLMDTWTEFTDAAA